MRTADRSIDAAIRLAFDNHELDGDEATVRWSAPDGLERGATVEVNVSYPVQVVRIPLVGDVAGPSVWVRSSHVARVDPFASR